MSAATVARRALALLDLTSLNERDTSADVEALCARALTPAGHVAAVCVHARFIPVALLALRGSAVKIATVANFPAGEPDADHAAREAGAAVDEGADEVDVVLPYRAYAAGERAAALAVVAAAREATDGAVLKVILETGALGDAATIRAAAADALALGADFVKTSTGTRAPGATPAAAAAILAAIEAAGHGGLKVSGGVRTVADAAAYLALADARLGADWATPARLRIGASGLLDALLEAGAPPS